MYLSSALFKEKKFDTPFLDPWVALAAIALKTTKIKIGTYITPLPRRKPWKLARETVSIDHLSNGRLILGIGLGAPNFEFEKFGEDSNPVVRGKKLDEGLHILQELWSGKSFSFLGEYFNIKEVIFRPVPVNGTIPIWIAGRWPSKKPFRRAAEYNGVCPINKEGGELTPAHIKEICYYIEQYRKNIENYDIVVGGSTPNNKKDAIKIIQPYLDAGATWWTERINQWKGTYKEMHERILSGPPKISNE